MTVHPGFKNMLRKTFFLLYSLVCATNAGATACASHIISWIKISSHGAVLVQGSFGTARSDDLGQTWNALQRAGSSDGPAGGIPSKVGDDLYWIENQTVWRAKGFDIDTTRFAVIPRDDSSPQPTVTHERNVVADINGRLYMCSSDRNHVMRYDPHSAMWQTSHALGFNQNGFEITALPNGRSAKTLLQDKRFQGRLTPTETPGAYWYHTDGSNLSCQQVLAGRKNIYAFGSDSAFASRDKGITWVGAPLPRLADYSYSMSRIFADEAGVLYTHDRTTILISRDAGSNWSPLILPALSVPAAFPQTALGSDGTNLYVLAGAPRGKQHDDAEVASQPGIYRVNARTHATTLLLRLPADGILRSLHHVDISSSGHVAVVIEDGRHIDRSRILLSKDRGRHWSTIFANQITSKSWTWCGNPPILRER